MPEGDTVWQTARSLDRWLQGRTVTVDLRVPRLATAGFVAATTSTSSYGKHLLTHFEGRRTLHTHLKMEGSWHLYRVGERWRHPAHEARVVLAAADRVAVGFALGVVELVDDDADAVGHLGPDLLAEEPDLGEMVRRLGATAGPIGPALLDQRILAGIGTVYRAETLFLTGTHPQTPIGQAPLERIVRRARALLHANRERAVRCTTGDLRRGRELWVYGRAGEPCRRCGTPVETDRSGPAGEERVGFWCPTCQQLLR